MNKRILAMLLAMIMVFSMVPVTALAADADCAICGHVHDATCGYVEASSCWCNGNTRLHRRNGDCTYSEGHACEHVCVHECVDTNNDCICDLCDTELPHSEHPSKYSYDETQHWKECWKCHEDATERTAHEPTYLINGKETHTVVCNVCGYQSQKIAHTDVDGNCVCDVCGGALAHNLTEVKWQDATCTENGNWTHWVCSTCKGTFTDATGETVMTNVVIPATNHSNTNGWSCDDEYHWEQCDKEDCKEVIGEKIAHTFEYKSNGEKTHKATCTVCKRVVDQIPHNFGDDCVCDDCGYTEHSLELFRDQDPTCTEAGWKWHYECSTCGKYFWDSGAASETTFEAVTLDATDHKNTNGLSCDDEYHWEQCDNKGCTAVIGEKDAHSFEYISNGAQTHKATCTECGRVVDKVAHNFGDDCICDDCGYTNHSLKWVAGVQPTCTENGMKGHWECENCGLLFANDTEKTNVITEEELVKPATNHTEGEWASDDTNHWKVCAVDGCEGIATEPEAHTFDAYRDNGNGTHRAWCSTCGAWVNFEHVDENADCVCDLCEVMLHEHTTPVFVRAKAATCTTAGTGAYWHWKGCDVQMFDVDTNERIYSVATTPATGHDWSGAWKDAGNGKHVKACANGCGETQTEAHVNLNGDCYCDYCGAALHSHELIAVAEVPATCTEMGVAAYWYYEDCGIMFSDENGTQRIWGVQYIPAKGHKWPSGWVNNALDDNHVKACLNGCGALQYGEHVWSVVDPLKGNYHQWICDCGVAEPEIHYDDDGDGECDECEHDMTGTEVAVVQHDSVTVTRTDGVEIEEEKPAHRPGWNGRPGTNNSQPTTPSEKPDDSEEEEPVAPPTRPGVSQDNSSIVIDEEFISQNYDKIVQLLQQVLNGLFNK